jgi:hypothetical protein
VFENRVLRRIFGQKRDEVTGELKKLHNEELCDLYSSPSIIRIIKSRRMRWAGHVARMEKRNAYRLLVGNPEGKRPLGRPRRRWVDNIRMDLGEVGWGDVDWIGQTLLSDVCRFSWKLKETLCVLRLLTTLALLLMFYAIQTLVLDKPPSPCSLINIANVSVLYDGGMHPVARVSN